MSEDRSRQRQAGAELGAAAPVRIEMLGGFRVIVPGSEPAESWPRRRAAELVQLLALSEARALMKEQVIDALWPQLGPDAGAANLRKAAHHVRRALERDDAVRLRDGRVELFGGVVETDVEELLERSERGLRDADPVACAEIASDFRELLPGSRYSDWVVPHRDELVHRQASLLSAAGQWERLVEVDPLDETAYRELMRRSLAEGRRHVAIRWYGRLRAALQASVGSRPEPATEEIYAECVSGIALEEPAFGGRELELAAAGDALLLAARCELGGLILRGPAGIGKTALGRRIAALARQRSWIVTSVAGTEDGVPYAPLATAVEQLLGRDRGLAESLPASSRSVLAELTALAGPTEPHDGPLTRHQVIEAVRRLLSLSADASGAGVLLAIDDAHLADDASIEAVRHLASNAGAPFLALFSYRPDAARPTLRDAVEAMARGGRAVELDLEPLEPDAIRAIVAASSTRRLDSEELERIVELAEGNPFFARELSRAAPAELTAELKPTLREAITRRFVGLEERDTTLLGRVAVAGNELDFASVAALTDLAEDRAASLLDRALACEVLVVIDGRYRFRHELVRRALAGSLPEHRRAEIHRDAASRLAELGASPAAVGRHWLEGGRPAEAAVWLLRAARQAAELGAFADALSLLDMLRECRPDDPEALCLRAEVLDFLGDGRAPDAYAEAARSAGEPEAHELRPREAFARLKSGDPAGAMAALEGAAPSSPAGRISEALTVSAAAAIGYLDDLDLAAAKAEEAYRLAVDLGESWAVLEASWAYALAAHAHGELPARLREYVRVSGKMPELATRLFDGQLCVTERLLYGGLPYPEVIAFADSLAAEAERLGAKRGEAFALTLRGEARLLSGDLVGAESDLVAGEQLHRDTSGAAGAAVALQSRALIRLQRSDPERARPLALAALGHARESQVGFHTFDRIYGTLVAIAPDPAAGLIAVQEAEAAVRGSQETCPTCRITFLVPAGIAAARAGDLTRARSYAEGAAALVDYASLPQAWQASVAEMRGHLARAEGEVEAVRHFREAADLFGATGQPGDQRRCGALATA